MDGDLLDIVCPRPASSSSACGDAVAPPSACCEGQAAIPPAFPPAKKVSAADARLQLEILGRGTHQEEVAKIPARATGLGDRIRFAGYIDPSLYPQHLSRFDLLLFLVPGSDGTCRAAREALACGVPVIASRRGLLPDLIPESCGLLLQNEAVETMAQAMLSLADDPLRRQQMARNAREYAQQTFDAEALGSTLITELRHPAAGTQP